MATRIRPATRADRAAVLATVAAAFAEDPVFRLLFRDPATFSTEATKFAGYLFDKRVALGTVWVAGDADAVALWDPPRLPGQNQDRTSHPEPTYADVGVHERLEAYDRAVSGHLPEPPYWYLGVLGTHPRAAGRGLGRLLMRHGLDLARADGLPAVLETTRPENVGLYERAGWRVLAEIVGAEPSPIWVMEHREPVRA